MYTAINGDIRINYRADGIGHPIILLHGLMSDLDSWYGGFAEELAKYFKVIALDIRGFGKSSKPHNPEKYDLKFLVNDIIAVLDNEKISEATVLGYSMGGRIAFACLTQAPDRFPKGIIGGMHLFPAPHREEFLKNQINDFQTGFESFLKRLEERIGPLDEETKNSILENDLEAIIAFNTKWLSTPYSTEVEVRNIKNPVLLFVGENDTPIIEDVKRTAKILPNCEFFIVENANHPQAVNKDVVIPKIKKFFRKNI